MANLNFDSLMGNEFAVTYNWDLVIDTSAIPTPLNTLFQEKTGMSIADFLDTDGILNQHCISAGLPEWTPQFAEATIRGHKLYQHGGVNEQGGSVAFEFYERADQTLGSFFEVWKRINWQDNTGAGYRKKNLLAPGGPFVSLSQLHNSSSQSDPTSAHETIRYDLYWPAIESCSRSSLGEDTSSLQQVSVSLKYGRSVQVNNLSGDNF